LLFDGFGEDFVEDGDGDGEGDGGAELDVVGVGDGVTDGLGFGPFSSAAATAS
jgi:hypothetical protein